MGIVRKPKLPKLFKKKEQHFNVIDLGSSEVKVAVVREADDLSQREIMGEGAKPQARSSIYAGKIMDLDAVIETVGVALDEAVMKAGVEARRTVVGLSGGIMIPKSYRVRIKRQSPDERLTDDEFSMLAEQIEEKTLSKGISELTQLDDGDYVRVETIFTGYLVDGARVNSPLDLPGAEVEITVLHYFMDSGKLRAVNNMIEQLDLDVVSMVDTTVNAAVGWQEKYDDFVLIDIGGDVTQVVVMEKGKVSYSSCLFIGGYDITAELSEQLQISIPEAEHLKINYAQGQLDQDRVREVRGVVTEIADVLAEGVVVLLRNAPIKDLPGRLVIGGESRHLSELKTVFASYPWNKESKLSVFPKIEVVTGKDPNFVELTQIEL